jgi:hypothetical protein
VHPEDEVTAWFTSQGMLVQRLSPGEYVGLRRSLVLGSPPGYALQHAQKTPPQAYRAD